MTLYIVEKPNQISPLKDALNANNIKDFEIFPLRGHFLQLKLPNEYSNGIIDWTKSIVNNELPFVPKKFERKVNPEHKTKLAELEKLVQKATHIVLATDPDPEGGAIGYELIEMFNVQSKLLGMIDMRALDKSLIQKCTKYDIPYKELAEESYARTHTDWMFGMNYTVAATVYLASEIRKLGDLKKFTVNAGTVKLPILRMIVDRDKQFESFKSIKKYSLIGKARKDGKEFPIKFIVDGEKDSLDKQFMIDAMTKINNNLKGTITNFLKTPKIKTSPLPYTYTELTVKASRKGIKGAEHVVEETYLKGNISYPGTPCPYLTDAFFLESKDVLNAIGNTNTSYNNFVSKINVPYRKHDAFNDKKVDGSHTGIVPTQKSGNGLNSNELMIYELVSKRYLALFYPDYEYISLSGKAKIIDNIDCTFSENVVKELGWKEIEMDDDSNEDDSKQQNIPDMKNGDQIEILGVSINEIDTKPLPRFDKPSLLEAMDKIERFFTDPIIKAQLKGKGIGTERTKPIHIDNLFEDGVAKLEKNKIVSTPKGRKIIELLPDNATSPILRANFDSKFTLIGQNKYKRTDLEDEMKKIIEDLILDLKNRFGSQVYVGNSSKIEYNNLICPKCKKTHIIANNDEQNATIYKCNNAKWNATKKVFEGCNFVVFANCLESIGQPKITIKQIEELFKNDSLKVNDKEIKLNLSNDKNFITILDNSGIEIKRQFSGPTQQDVLFENKKAYTYNGKTIWKEYLGKTITKKQAEELFKGKRISITGLTSKVGKTFDAYVIFKDDKTQLDGFIDKKK